MAVPATAFLDTLTAAPDWSDSEYPPAAGLYLSSSIDASASDSGENLKVSARNHVLRSHC